jgi:hypothetical protein
MGLCVLLTKGNFSMRISYSDICHVNLSLVCYCSIPCSYPGAYVCSTSRNIFFFSN